MEAAVWRCHGLFASKSSAAAQEGNPGARALLKKSSVEGKGLDETTGELASASRKGWSQFLVHTATRFWVPFASRQMLRLTSEAEPHMPRKVRVDINLRNVKE
jgi:hypothetical protein